MTKIHILLNIKIQNELNTKILKYLNKRLETKSIKIYIKNRQLLLQLNQNTKTK